MIKAHEEEMRSQTLAATTMMLNDPRLREEIKKIVKEI
jgi:hypothetical protein